MKHETQLIFTAIKYVAHFATHHPRAFSLMCVAWVPLMATPLSALATPLNATNQSPEVQCDALCEETHSLTIDGIAFTLVAARSGEFEVMPGPQGSVD